MLEKSPQPLVRHGLASMAAAMQRQRAGLVASQSHQPVILQDVAVCDLDLLPWELKKIMIINKTKDLKELPFDNTLQIRPIPGCFLLCHKCY